MDRTWIGVHGKRRKRTPPLDVDSPTVVQPVQSIVLRKPSATRQPEVTYPESVKKARWRAPHGSRKSKTRVPSSPLERLPGELLSNIFLYCMEASLPLSSPRIAAKLSSQFILMEYSLRTFGLSPSDSTQPVSMKRKNQLLSRRFFSWEFLSALLSTAGKRYAPINEYSCIFMDCSLPHKLLHGPWTVAKVEMLAFLTEDGKCWVRPDDYTVCSIIIEGVYDAIRGSLFKPLNILLKSSLIVETIQESKRYPEPTPVTSVKYIYVTLDMIYTAIFEHDCPVGVVCMLLIHAFRSTHDVDFLDAKLWIWAERAGSKGAWIQWLLRGLSRMQDCTIVVTGRANRRSAQALIFASGTFEDVLRLDGMTEFEPEDVVNSTRNHLRETVRSVCNHSSGMGSRGRGKQRLTS